MRQRTKIVAMHARTVRPDTAELCVGGNQLKIAGSQYA